jgi:hypothetical protein
MLAGVLLCVSTVSSVCEYQPLFYAGQRSSSSPAAVHFADAADGTDDHLGNGRTYVHHADRAGPQAPFTPEDNFNPDGAKEGLRPPQSASECAWAVRPPRPSAGSSGAIHAGLQKVGCASRPLHPLNHDLAHPRRHGISIDYVLDRLTTIVQVSSFDSAGWLKLALASCRPKNKVRHPW